MASDRQIAANRRNAQKSTGPRTADGKQRSRTNAVKHGLTAETVVTALEDVDAFEAFEAALIADYDPQSTIEFQLVGRIASLLWRLRRATLIETGLFEIQAGMVQEHTSRREATAAAGQLAVLYQILRKPYVPLNPGPSDPQGIDIAGDGHAHSAAAIERPQGTDMASVYLRLCHITPDVLDRLNRYEIALWRQLAQTLIVLQQVKHCRPRSY